jgi:hypothetical protein
MNTRFEQFIRENHEAFDDALPSQKVWNNIEEKILPVKKKNTVWVRMNIIKLASAAAVILIILGICFMVKNQPDSKINATNNEAVLKVQSINPGKKLPDTAAIVSEKNTLVSSAVIKKDDLQKDGDIDNAETDTKDELYHFTKIVEIKQSQLKMMAKNKPLLYQQFTNSVNKLDSVYHLLETGLSKKQNSEELFEAMIQNLQLQMQLLNQQLEIIKKLNHSKKTVYEKTYQSI